MPLRLARLGASSAAIGATFVVASLLSVVVSRLAGRMADRQGPKAPLAIGLGLSGVLVVLLVFPAAGVLLAALIVLTIGGALTMYMVPAMTYMTFAVESLGIALMTGTMLLNFAWSAGETIGAPAAAGLSQATGNACPLLLLAALMLITYLVVKRTRPLAARSDRPKFESSGPDTNHRTPTRQRSHQARRGAAARDTGSPAQRAPRLKRGETA
jgi:MFS family permease